MPQARPPIPPRIPADLAPEEIDFIKSTIARFYGVEAVVRNSGPNPTVIQLHVESDLATISGLERWECLGVLMTRIDRKIELIATKRATRIRGLEKIAYRQGIIL